MPEKYTLARQWVRDEGKWLRDAQAAKKNIRADSKTSHQDIVTPYDRAVEERITRKIKQAFPMDIVVGEESFAGDIGGGENVWYLDPIDGTTNFVNQQRDYAISLAYYEAGRGVFGVVLDVAADEMYHASAGAGAYRNEVPIRANARPRVRDMLLASSMVLETLAGEHAHRAALAALARDARAVRSMGCVALELCGLASGRFDLFATVRSCPWDHNAARVILSEAGGDIRSLDGAPVPPGYAGGILAAGNAAALRDIFAAYFTRKG